MKLYDCYMKCTPRDLFAVGIALYKQGELDELRSPYYSYAGEQFAKGNPWVPYNNAYDTALNEARLMTYNDYSDDTLKQINELGDRFREWTRKGNLLLAYLFFNRVIQSEPSNEETLSYMKNIMSKMNLSHVNVIRNAYAMFKDLGFIQWTEVCNNLINSIAGKSAVPEIHEGMLEKADEILNQDPNNVVGLLLKGFSLFNMAKKEINLESKLDKFSMATSLINKAITIMPGIVNNQSGPAINEVLKTTTEFLDSIKKGEQHKKNMETINRIMKQNDSSNSDNQGKRIKYYTSEGKPVY